MTLEQQATHIIWEAIFIHDTMFIVCPHETISEELFNEIKRQSKNLTYSIKEVKRDPN